METSNKQWKLAGMFGMVTNYLQKPQTLNLSRLLQRQSDIPAA